MLLFAIALAAGCSPRPFELPTGWRMPKATDYFDPSVASEVTNPVSGEFLQAGAKAFAHLLVSETSGDGAVFLSAECSPPVRVTSMPAGVADYAVEVLGPGLYRVAGEPVALLHDAILVRKVEYETGTLFWLSGEQWQAAHTSVGELEPLAK